MSFFCICPICRVNSLVVHIRQTFFPTTFAFDQTTCTICLENFVVNESLTILRCNHVFHEVCITRWSESRIQIAVPEQRDIAIRPNVCDIFACILALAMALLTSILFVAFVGCYIVLFYNYLHRCLIHQ